MTDGKKPKGININLTSAGLIKMIKEIKPILWMVVICFFIIEMTKVMLPLFLAIKH